jgi:DHA2 family multidrug resistance protein
VLASGFLLGARGIGTFFAMMAVGRLLGKVDARILIGIGLTLATASIYVMVGWTQNVSAKEIVIDSVVQGVGLGLVFVPLNTVAFATLPAEWRTDGAAVWTLIRNIGSSVGISIVIAQLTNMVTTFHSQLVEHVTPFSDALKLPDAAALSTGTLGGLAQLDGIVTQQAAIIAYSNDFLLMMFVSLSAFPLLALIRGAKSAPAPSGHSAAAAME